MKNILRTGCAVLLVATCLSSAATADSLPYKARASTYGGQSVSSYTNAGAQHYYRNMRSAGSGKIYNIAPKPKYRSKEKSLSKLKIPKSVSYKKSHKKDLDPRFLGHGANRTDIAEIVEKYGKLYNLDPMLIEEVIRQESNFRPTASSSVGAQGLMQLMPGTARMMGVRNANDPEQNIRGGSRYLAEQLTRFGRLDYALAAYNAGPGAVKSYGGIPPYRETRNYVARIVNKYNNRVRQERKKKGKKR